MLKATQLSVGSRLKPLDLQVGAGECVAVLGPNGAGKSTLLAALAGLLPFRGHVAWQGEDLARIPFLQRGRRLAWLGQESWAEFDFSVRDVVAQGRYAWGEDGRGVEEAMALLDLTHLAQRPVTQLSGGERRRVFLARALTTAAPIQLWDEPASSLDVRHGLEVYALAQRKAAQGSCLLVSLHDIRAAYRFSRVLVLEEGRIQGDGPPHEVLSADLIRRVFRVEATFTTSLVPELPVIRS
ncbi:MAG: ABC transporter ATP-binding protein [Firmicutes bacterium]|nr:ABC transporter ATP-binding protein [Bacillota bacterium]